MSNEQLSSKKNSQPRHLNIEKIFTDPDTADGAFGSANRKNSQQKTQNNSSIEPSQDYEEAPAAVVTKPTIVVGAPKVKDLQKIEGIIKVDMTTSGQNRQGFQHDGKDSTLQLFQDQAGVTMDGVHAAGLQPGFELESKVGTKPGSTEASGNNTAAKNVRRLGAQATGTKRQQELTTQNNTEILIEQSMDMANDSLINSVEESLIQTTDMKNHLHQINAASIGSANTKQQTQVTATGGPTAAMPTPMHTSQNTDMKSKRALKNKDFQQSVLTLQAKGLELQNFINQSDDMDDLFMPDKNSPAKKEISKQKGILSTATLTLAKSKKHQNDSVQNLHSQMSIFSDLNQEQQRKNNKVFNTNLPKKTLKSRNQGLPMNNRTTSKIEKDRQIMDLNKYQQYSNKAILNEQSLQQSKESSSKIRTILIGTGLKGFQSLPRIPSKHNESTVNRSVNQENFSESLDHMKSAIFQRQNIATKLIDSVDHSYAGNNSVSDLNKLTSDNRIQSNFHRSQNKFSNYCDKSIETLNKYQPVQNSFFDQKRNSKSTEGMKRDHSPISKPQKLRELLAIPGQSKSPLDTFDQKIPKLKPVLKMNKQDFKQLMQGKQASRTFVDNNKAQIQTYLNAVMQSEDKMLGYLEFSNANQIAESQPKDMMAYHQQQMEKGQQDAAITLENQARDTDVSFRSPEKNRERNCATTEPQARQTLGKGVDDSKMIEDFDKLIAKNNKKLAKLHKPLKENNAVQKAYGITHKVMETWLNETLNEAEHLDIPGVILRPEHKNPISRYGIDRIELTNLGIPNDFVNRIYRCLFVYSVGFYEMINRVIEHSGQKYSLITRIWKVFAILIEYCCTTDYKMMIQNIQAEHEQNVEKLNQDFQAQIQLFMDAEKIIKQNMRVLQQSNDDLEKDRTNERQLRLRLEEEYMQNTKNHEEEVQLRLKFESKLNSMHTQQRETDIKYNRSLDDLKQAQTKSNNQADELKNQRTTILNNEQKMQNQKERLDLLETSNDVLTQEIENKSNQLKELDSRLKIVTEENAKNRMTINDTQNDNNTHQFRIQILEAQVKQLTHQKQTLELLLKDSNDNKDAFMTKTKELKEKCDEAQVNLNTMNTQVVINSEDLGLKSKQVELQTSQIQELTKMIEDLMVNKKNQTLEVETLSTALTQQKTLLEESVDKLHVTNRYRHELEIKYKAEKLTQERLRTTLETKEEEIKRLNTQLNDVRGDLQKSGYKNSQLSNEIKDLKDVIQNTIENNANEIAKLKGVVDQARIEKEEWLTKFVHASSEISEAAQRALSLEQQIELKDQEIEKGNLRAQKMQETLFLERGEREQAEQESKEAMQKLKDGELELKELLSVSRQLEKQRYQQYKQANQTFKAMQKELFLFENRHLMEIEDMSSVLLREQPRIEALYQEVDQLKLDQDKLIIQCREEKNTIIYCYEQEKENVQMEIERRDMQYEELLMRSYNRQADVEKVEKENAEVHKALAETQKELDDLTNKFNAKSKQMNQIERYNRQLQNEFKKLEKDTGAGSAVSQMPQMPGHDAKTSITGLPELVECANKEVQVNLLPAYTERSERSMQPNKESNGNFSQSYKPGNDKHSPDVQKPANEKYLSEMKQNAIMQNALSDPNGTQHEYQQARQEASQPQDPNSNGTANLLLNQKGLKLAADNLQSQNPTKMVNANKALQSNVGKNAGENLVILGAQQLDNAQQSSSRQQSQPGSNKSHVSNQRVSQTHSLTAQKMTTKDNNLNLQQASIQVTKPDQFFMSKEGQHSDSQLLHKGGNNRPVHQNISDPNASGPSNFINIQSSNVSSIDLDQKLENQPQPQNVHFNHRSDKVNTLENSVDSNANRDISHAIGNAKYSQKQNEMKHRKQKQDTLEIDDNTARDNVGNQKGAQQIHLANTQNNQHIEGYAANENEMMGVMNGGNVPADDTGVEYDPISISANIVDKKPKSNDGSMKSNKSRPGKSDAFNQKGLMYKDSAYEQNLNLQKQAESKIEAKKVELVQKQKQKKQNAQIKALLRVAQSRHNLGD